MMNFISQLWSSRSLLLSFSVRDIRRRYLGSLLGFIWVFIQPLTTLLVIWFVFEYGFKTKPVNVDVPFSLWLISAMVPWFFISDAISSSAHSILDQANIVKKIAFRVSLLPVVKVNSAVLVHFVFLMILFLIAVLQGVWPTAQWLLIIYYLIASIIFVLGLAWLTSSISVFFRDMTQIIAVVIQIGFWATPIFWDISLIADKYHYLFKLNPVFYLTEGYRMAICGGEPPILDMNWTLYFWFMTMLIFLLGIICFKRLKPHFSEVL